MSFFKKMVDKFEDLVGDDDKKKDEKKEEKKKEDKHEGMLTLGVSLSEVNTARTICRLTSSAAATKDQSFQNQQAPYGQQPQYGQSQAYGAPPPSHAPSTGGPPLPPGWIAQWDQNSQRYYYLDQATGRTQWELPQPPQGSYPPPGAPQGSFPPAGAPMGAPGYDTRSAPGGYYSQETKQVVPNADGSGYKATVEKKEKKDGKGGMLAAGAGGLAVGAVGGAMIGHAMGDDSDEEHRNYSQQPSYGQQPGYAQQPQPGYYQETGPPPLEAPPPGDHSSVSSSDREDLAEARKDYENASDASDREEAREDYEEAYEEAYD
ncbi:MAG: hypothetical protein LQ349_008969 [Xanthoria aureola]|nr:MAG: hypothetical protein LQ349_008969 [Xanthoria aureola]